jgi:hypothetical protein
VDNNLLSFERSWVQISIRRPISGHKSILDLLSRSSQDPGLIEHTSNYATTAFHILYDSLFSDHPIIHRYIVLDAESIVKQVIYMNNAVFWNMTSSGVVER